MGHPLHACRICGWWGWIPMKATGAFRYMAGVGFLLYHFVIPPLAQSHMISAFSISWNLQTKRKGGTLLVKPAETRAQTQSGSCVVLEDVCLGASPKVVSVVHFRPQERCARATTRPGSQGSRPERSLRRQMQTGRQATHQHLSSHLRQMPWSSCGRGLYITTSAWALRWSRTRRN